MAPAKSTEGYGLRGRDEAFFQGGLFYVVGIFQAIFIDQPN